MSAPTNIKPIRKDEEAPESLLAFSFDESGRPTFIDDCKSAKDAFALLAFAGKVIEQKLRELSEEAMKRTKNAA